MGVLEKFFIVFSVVLFFLSALAKLYVILFIALDEEGDHLLLIFPPNHPDLFKGGSKNLIPIGQICCILIKIRHILIIAFLRN